MAEQETPSPVSIQALVQPQLCESTAAVVNPDPRPEVPSVSPTVEQVKRPRCFCDTIPKAQLEAEAKLMYFKQFRTLNLWFRQGLRKEELMAMVNRYWTPLPAHQKQIYYAQYVEKLSKDLVSINPRLQTPMERRQLEYLRSEGRPGAPWTKKPPSKGPLCPVCSVPATRLNPSLIRLVEKPRLTTPIQQDKDLAQTSLGVAPRIGPKKAVKRQYHHSILPAKPVATASNLLESDSASIQPCDCSDCVPLVTPRPEKRPRYIRKAPAEKKPRKVREIKIKDGVENKVKQVKPRPRVEKRTASASFSQEDPNPSPEITISPETQRILKKCRISLDTIDHPQAPADGLQHHTSQPVLLVNWTPTGDAIISQIDQQQNATETLIEDDGKESAAEVDRILNSTEAEEQDVFQWMLGM